MLILWDLAQFFKTRMDGMSSNGSSSPTVRPSVKHDAQQRSEDDLTHIIVNIIKANKSLQEKIQQNASSKYY